MEDLPRLLLVEVVADRRLALSEHTSLSTTLLVFLGACVLIAAIGGTTIGIITAIVGNVLIALALNVQRYAHIRLHQQRAQYRERAKQALKNATNGANAFFRWMRTVRSLTRSTSPMLSVKRAYEGNFH